MTRDRRLLLLLGLLMAYGLFVVECHQRKDATTEARHRHRHKHESTSRKSHHDPDRRSWQEVDYEYDGDAEEDSTGEDDYEMPSYYDHLRSYQQQRSHHGRMFEPHYPARYHGGGYHGSGWYDSDRRKILPRYNAKNRRYTPGRSYYGRAYSRNHDASDYDDDTRGDFDYGRSHRYVEDGATDKHPGWRRNARRRSSLKKDWRSRMYGRLDAWRHRLKGRTVDRDKESKWTEYWRRKSNSSEYKAQPFEDGSKSAEDEDYKDHGGLEESDKDDEEEEEDDIWKIFDDKDEEDDELEVLDNDFYKNKSKSVLTYDDIIRKLTSDDPTTARTTVKRDYRNIEDKHAKHEGYRHLKYESRNVSRVLGPYTFANKPIINRSHNAVSKPAVSDEPKSPKNVFTVATKRNDWQEGNQTAVKINETHSTRTKSKRGDLDNEGYLYSPDNEKEDDFVTDEEEDSDMQADVTDTGYTDDDNDDEDSVDTKSKTAPAATKTTTTTSKWLINHPHGKNTRAYGRGTAAEYNGHQPKNDYPPMSAHSVYKWRTLGTRESVKQTMNSMRQSNNGEHAAMQEASLYWNKVKEEGSCKWPRAKLIRVSKFYPDSSVSYFPHCVILHECSDNTGCCASDQFTCVASKSRSVELTVYARSMNGSYQAVRLMFNNHTECECRDRTVEMQRINQSLPSPQNMKITPPMKLCKCTKYFMVRRNPQGDCRCECQDKNDNCRPISKGKRILDFEDRECIRNGECTEPTCEFGMFRLLEYKCPAKKDTFDAAARHGAAPQRQMRRNDRRNRIG